VALNTKAFVRFDGMTWPVTGEILEDRVWKFVHNYESLTRIDHLVAVSIMRAYDSLIDMPIKRRNKVISDIKKAMASESS